MRKKTILAALTIVMMLFTMIPATVSAAQSQAADAQYVETLEQAYDDYIKDRSKYCKAVWDEIQQAYLEGRECYSKLEDLEAYFEAPDYETMLKMLGKLTWVKNKNQLPDVKKRYLKEINDEYKNHKKSDYSDYSWDLIQDGLFVGKKQINNATTFLGVANGYSEAMQGMEWATTKEDLKEYKKECITELGRLINLYLDKDDYIASKWKQITGLHDEAVKAINKAQLEYELDSIMEEYAEKICNLAGLEYPLGYEVIEEIYKEIMAPAVDFFEDMDDSEYTLERIEDAEEIIWDLEEDIYDAKNRDAADKKVAAALKKLKALPNREYDEKVVKTYVVKAKAVGASGTSVKISWNASKDLDGYIVYRSDSKNGKYKEVWYTYNGNKSSYIDKKLTYGKNYFYKVQGIKEIDWEEEYTKMSAPVKATPKLVAPSVKLSKNGSADVLLKWNKVPGADGYQIYRSNSINGQFKLVKTVKKGTTVQWKDTSTVKGKNYCYKMRTYDVQKNGTKKYSVYSTIKIIKR